MAASQVDLTGKPSVGALVRYLHAAAGFPVKSTWLAAIKAGNYASWSGLTYANASKYYPVPIETLQGHLKQTRMGVRSTKVTQPLLPTSQPDKPTGQLAPPCTYVEVTKSTPAPAAATPIPMPSPTDIPALAQTA